MKDDVPPFEKLLEPHLDRLYRLSWRLAGERTEAEDLFQEVLIRAYTKLDELSDIDDPGPWLGRVMYNLFIDRHRRHARQRMRLVDEGGLPGDGIEGLPGGSQPDVDSERAETMHKLDAALAQLSDEHRIVVLLHDTEGYKLREIESLTGTPVGTLKSRLHRARARLRQILAEDGTFS